MTIPTIESRVASLETVQTQINERLNNLEQGQRELSTRMENRLISLDNRINSNFKWIVALLISGMLANVGTAITIILALSKP
ncbi:MAG: hypothetical protein OXG87_11805 [Gemmatimonadetes bacterium]|nr:hypothetical protein [Gemmatimonadota bacterium]